MRVYLVRHGEAEGVVGDPGLSALGREQARASAIFAEENGVRPASIFHSKKKRARETAEEIAKVISPPEGLSEKAGLSPNDDPTEWADYLQHESDDIMLVGHMPFMPTLAALMLTGNTDNWLTNFENAAMLALVRSGHGRWLIEWFISPPDQSGL